nr:MAG TPA: hypothetical protein [Caudoviricetes sp.]
MLYRGRDSKIKSHLSILYSTGVYSPCVLL